LNKFASFILCLILILSCTPDEKHGSRTNTHDLPLLVLSILPQEYFARRIGGDRIDTTVLAGHGQNPHNYEPNPRQIQSLVSAGAWILSGTEFEISLEPKIRDLFPLLRIIDGTEGIRFRCLEAHNDHDHYDHDHDEGIDRHTWLGLQGAEIMSGHIKDALCAIDAPNASHYIANYENLISEMRYEFGRLKNELEMLEGETVLVYHPAFGYFLDEFGIIQEAVETDGKEPAPRTLAGIIERAKSDNVRVIFVQAQFPAESAGVVAAEVNAELVILDPLSPDWLENIKTMGEALKRASVRIPGQF